MKSNKNDKSAAKELKVHIKDVTKAKSSLQKDAGKLKKDIGKDIGGALKQDKIIQKFVKKSIKDKK